MSADTGGGSDYPKDDPASAQNDRGPSAEGRQDRSPGGVAEERSTGEDPAGDEPAGDEPAGNEPAGNEPAGNEPAGNEPERGGSAGPRPSDPDGSESAGTLTPQAMGGPAQRPPRRTGVFLDPDDLRHHVGGLLRAILGGYEVDGFGNFTFQHEGARAFVTVGPSPIGPQVGIFSVTNLDLDLSPPLASFLLTTNHKLGFGAFSYDESNRAVWLRHTLLGSTLDLPELQSAVAAVATTAAALDETIRDRFGGRTFSEAPEDVQQHLEPPDAAGSPRPPNASGYL